MAQLHKSILALRVYTGLNIKVGGAYASQHTLGEAADIYIPKTAYTDWDDNKAHTDKELAERWFSWLQSHTDFD